jgi:pimeloyl-ACP methyl ester carboxylesterase/DNA-binding winged helix-turn-helix (wHTH) protein
MLYCFGDYELDTKLFELRKGGEPQRLEPQVFDVLAYLVQNRDRLVTKDELLQSVWGDKYISEAALNSRLMAARRAIGDSGHEQRLIRTQHARGFRFVGEVEQRGQEVAASRASGAGIASGVSGSLERQKVRFCETEDGLHIAYATVGEGPPIVKAPNWLTHLEYEWQNPVWRHWWQELARDFEVIRFDQRGSGLSDREVADISFEAWVNDLETVVEAAGLQKFALLGVSQGGAVAVEYAVRHPERVTRLVLYGAFAHGWRLRGQSVQEHEAVLTLIREGWGRDLPVYRQLFTLTFMPDATTEQAQWFNELQRVSTSPENAARFRSASGDINVTARLPLVSVPTLVLHATGDQRVPFDEGRRIASLIPDARFVALESRNHLTLEEEPAWPQLVAEVRAFLHEAGS